MTDYERGGSKIICFSECRRCIDGRKEFGTDTRALCAVHERCTPAAHVFSSTSVSFVLVILAGILWGLREGEFLLLVAQIWHFAHVFEGEHYYPA